MFVIQKTIHMKGLISLRLTCRAQLVKGPSLGYRVSLLILNQLLHGRLWTSYAGVYGPLSSIRAV